MNIIFKDIKVIDPKLKIGISMPAILKRKGYIKFVLPYGHNKLFRFIHDKVYPTGLIEPDFYQYPLLGQMGYFEYTHKPTWQDFKLFLHNIVYEYRIFVFKKIPIMEINPLNYKIGDSIDEKDIDLA